MRTAFITLLLSITWMVVELTAAVNECTPGFIHFEETNACYIILPEKYTWSNGKKECERAGLELARPGDISPIIINKLRKNLVQLYGDGRAGPWLNARVIMADAGGIGEWRWNFGNKHTVAPGLLLSGYPTDDGWCMILFADNKSVNDYPDIPYGWWSCDSPSRTLCQEATTASTVPVTNVQNPITGAIQLRTTTGSPVATSEAPVTVPTSDEEPNYCQFVTSIECQNKDVAKDCGKTCKPDPQWCDHFSQERCSSISNDCPNKCSEKATTAAPVTVSNVQNPSAGAIQPSTTTECMDILKVGTCDTFVRLGHCSKHGHVGCRKTCSFCTSQECMDILEVGTCDDFVNRGLCLEHGHVGCRKTCAFCTSQGR